MGGGPVGSEGSPRCPRTYIRIRAEILRAHPSHHPLAQDDRWGSLDYRRRAASPRGAAKGSRDYSATHLAFLDQALLYGIERLTRFVATLIRGESIVEVLPQLAMLRQI